jgi:hypothetical protein
MARAARVPTVEMSRVGAEAPLAIVEQVPTAPERLSVVGCPSTSSRVSRRGASHFGRSC